MDVIERVAHPELAIVPIRERDPNEIDPLVVDDWIVRMEKVFRGLRVLRTTKGSTGSL